MLDFFVCGRLLTANFGIIIDGGCNWPVSIEGFVRTVVSAIYFSFPTISSCSKSLFECLFFLQMFDCKNHIRVIQPMDNGTRLYICGTNAHSPKDVVIFVSNI